MDIPNFEFVRLLGSGSFGHVFEVIQQSDRKKYALKRIMKVGNIVSREYQILQMLNNCEHIIRIKNIFYTRSQNAEIIQNLLMDYMEDNLEAVISEYRIKLDQQTIKYIFYQIIMALDHLSSKNISHRDLKPENILISGYSSKRPQIKICDFGSAKVLSKDGKNTPYVVSRYYRAPELILAISHYNVGIDMWSAGCILAELILMKPLFLGQDEADTLFKIHEIMGSATQEDIEFYSQYLIFDTAAFQSFPQFSKNDRLRDMFKDKFTDIDNLIDLLNQMFLYNFEKRITPKEVLKHPFFDEIKHMIPHKRL